MSREEFKTRIIEAIFNTLDMGNTICVSYNGGGIVVNGEVKNAAVDVGDNPSLILSLDEDDMARINYYIPDEDAGASYKICVSEDGTEYNVITKFGSFILTTIGI